MGEKRGTYSSPRQQARQERILQSARQLIADKGYDGLTMRDLARASGVSDKTLYNLFGSKDRLLMQAVADLLKNIVRSVEAQEQQPGLETLLLYTDSITGQILATPAYAEAMSRGLFQAEASNPLVDVLLRANEQFLYRELDAALQRGELLPGTEIAAVASMLTGHMWGILLLWNKGLLAVEQLPAMINRSLCLSLLGIVRGRGKTLVAQRVNTN